MSNKINQTTLKEAFNGDESAQRALYLDYANNFITVKGFSEHYNIPYERASKCLLEWRLVHEIYCCESKGEQAND